MLILKVLSLYVGLFLKTEAVPLKTNEAQPVPFVRPIEEVFQELDGYYHDEIVSFDSLKNGGIKPIEEIFGELDNYYQSTTPAFPDEEIIFNPIEDLLPIEEVFEELDGDKNNTRTDILSGFYRLHDDKVTTQSFDRSVVKPIEEIFQELDNYSTTTEPMNDENLTKVLFQRNEDVEVSVRPIEEIFQELDGNYTTELSNEDEDSSNYILKRIYKTRNVKPIEEIFQELDSYQNETEPETDPDNNLTIEQQIKINLTDSVIKPIEEIFEELYNAENYTTVDPILDENNQTSTESPDEEDSGPEINETLVRNTNLLLRNNVRPGMIVTSYAIEIEPNIAGGTFSGRAIAQVILTDIATIEDPIMFQAIDLNVVSVLFAIGGGATFRPAEFFVIDDEGLLEIQSELASLYTFIIEYEGQLNQNGQGLYLGSYDGK